MTGIGRLMDTTKVKRMIGQCDDPKEVGEIIKAATNRQALLCKRQYQERCLEAWERVRVLARNATLHVCAGGTFLGGPLQRGDSMTVIGIQPRVKRLWARLQDGTSYWFGPAGVERYDLRLEPPASPIGPNERKLADSLGKALDTAF
jgi:hypothetical protein